MSNERDTENSPLIFKTPITVLPELNIGDRVLAFNSVNDPIEFKLLQKADDSWWLVKNLNTDLKPYWKQFTPDIFISFIHPIPSSIKKVGMKTVWFLTKISIILGIGYGLAHADFSFIK